MELAQLAVFARPPRPGRAKTRLAGLLGDQGAAKLHDAFVQDTIRLCRRVQAAGRVDVALWTTDEVDATVRDWATRLRTAPRIQPKGDLGERLSAAFQEGLRRYERVVIIGSDAPSLPLDLIVRAFDSLEKASIVLGPANDGGYYAIGARHHTLPRFEGVRWSSRTALRDTLDANTGREIAILPPWYDIDEPDDLAVLRAHLSADPGVAPATGRCLAELRSAHR